ncbi:MAG: valine--tRNA ligase, partial [Anaerolineales bacterium]|nr:valine--tRNA ligase [Anaerolineales bacterium]
MSDATLPKTYDFRATEQRLYAWWEENGWFKPSNDPAQAGFDPSRKPFVIPIPPPNITGELHLGHAMFVAVEDLMIRYHRMRGEPTLWVPGSDHAGIATQLVVEQELLRSEEVTREELGRDAFVARAWEWKRKYGSIIYDQLRRLGASCDWSRERFTLDAGLSLAVREAFVRLYEKGLIYRGPRLINWSPGLKTAVSDLEVEYSEEPGQLYYFKYRLKGSDAYIPVATTRPETILADTGLAVHPADERFQRFIGQTALVPILDREVPVIADEAVSRDFGTGALKITPGHDPTDYEIGARHGLPIISMFDREARVTEAGGPYQGLDRFEARQRLWADMQRAGLTIKSEPYTLNVPRSQRGGEIVEPMISTQWFVTIQPLAEAALAAVRDGRIHIVPEHFEKVYFNWLENIRDWCISRQLWWGHRIPVWYCPKGHMTTGRTDPTACGTCGSTELTQDPDVLDTWFSSGLWPFSTLGWPAPTPDLAYFYPTSVLETGYDILFFWVARMIMFGLEFTGQPPFHTVYLHGIIRDGEGRKMSKTLGNVVDPRVLMDDFGTDALRFTLLTAGTPGNDLNLSLQRVESNRNFANKLWNMARFVTGNLPAGFSPAAPRGAAAGLSLADRWVLARLHQTIADANRLMEAYEFGQAGTLVSEFLWGDYADWYIESAKVVLAGAGEADKDHTRQVLVHVLDQGLRLLHPFVPFVTEAIWQHLPRPAGEVPALIVAAWPAAGAIDAEALARFGHLQEVVRAIRNARSENKVEQARRIGATLVAGDQVDWLTEQRPFLIALARLDAARLRIVAQLPQALRDRQSIALVIGATEVYLPLEGLVDLAAERQRLASELETLDRQIAKSAGLLGSDFAAKAPPVVVAKERAKLESLQGSRQKVAERLEAVKA